MKIRFLVFTFMMIFFSACNVAEQSPKPQTEQSLSGSTSTTSSSVQQTVKFRRDRETTNEGSGSVTIYLEREGYTLPANQKVLVKYMGSADTGDFSSITVNATPVTFVSGTTDTFEVPFGEDVGTKEVTITLTDDATFEVEELLQFQIISDENNTYKMDYPTQMGIVIEDNDSIPSVNFHLPTSAAVPKTITEGNPYSIQIDLANPSYADIKVPIRISANSVANSNDHTLVDQTVTFTAGSTTQTINFNVNADTFNELDEMLIIELGNPLGGVLAITNTTYYLKILDGNPDPTYDLSAADGTVGEANDTEELTLTLNLSGTDTIENELIVPYTVTPTSGNIYANVDYKIDKGYFSFDAGSSNGATAKIIITGIDDNLYEQSDETIQITVADTDFATAGVASASVTISDDEAASGEGPKVQFSSGSYLTQEGSTIYIPVSLGAPSPSNWYDAATSTLDDDPNVSLTTSTIPNRIELDFSGVPAAATTLIFNTKTGTQTFTYGTDYCASSCLTDTDVSAALKAALNSNSDFTNSYSANIKSDDNSILIINGPISTRSDENITFTYTLTGTATSGTDYSLSNGSFTITAGLETTNIPIMIYNDSVFDQNETITITLNAVTSSHGELGGLLSTTLTIKEAGTLPSVSFNTDSVSATESATPTNFTLGLSQVSEYDIDITLTTQDNSTEATDYSAISTSEAASVCTVASNVVTIKAGNTSCILDITLTDDILDEPAEQLTIKIQQPNNLVIGTYGSYMINILDNDSPPQMEISFNGAYGAGAGSETLHINEGDPVQTVYFHLDQASGYDIILQYNLVNTSDPDAATENADYTILTTGTILIPEGQTTASIDVKALSDGLYESGGTATSTEEKVDFQLIIGNNYTLAAQDLATLYIKDEDGDTPPTLNVQGLVTLETNENDIVNVAFTLNKPTSNAITVEYTVDDSVQCATLDANLYKCANIYTDPTTSDASNLVSQLSGAVGQVTIPAGSTQGVLSFTVDKDELFELSSHNTLGTDYTRKEQFRITVTDIKDASATASVIGVDAQIDAADDYIDINITDLDITPVAFFAQPTFKSQNEGIANLEIPINVSSKAEADITYHIQIIQQADSGYNLIDENDFTYTADSQPNGYLDAFGNLEPETTVLSVDDTAGTPTHANEGLLYTNASNVIFEGQFTIPAHQDVEILTLNINNDNLYEGSEQFYVKIIDDPAETTYQWQVNYLHNEYKVTMIESSDFPSISWDAANLTTVAEGTEVEATVNAATAYYGGMTLARTNVDFIFNVSPISQHDEITFDIALSGTASNYHSYFITNYDYMLGDYLTVYSDIGAAGTLATDYSATYDNSANGRISVVVPAGTGFSQDEFQVQISQDYRYEPTDDTIIATVLNTNNANAGSPSEHTLTIDDDTDDDGDNDGNGDYRPYVVYNELPMATYDEKDYSGWELILSNSTGLFKGKYITNAEATLDYVDQGTLRAGGTTAWNSGTLTFKEADNFTAHFKIYSETLGFDPRAASSVAFEMHSPTEANLDTAQAYYVNPSTHLASAAYEGSFNLTFSDLDVEISKVSNVILDNNGNDTSSSHSCTFYRGLVSCFGYNGYGQLGRGNTDAYGLNPGEDITAQANVLDLGSDSAGNPLYVTDMALGASHSCALFADGRVKCWGDNSYGQLGSGSTATNIGSAATDMGDNLAYLDLGTNAGGDPLRAIQIEASKYTTCAIMEDSTIKCWGRNNYGQLGIENTNNVGTSASDMGDNLQTVKISGSFSMLTGGDGFFCAKKEAATDTLHCWGNNNYGQLGLNLSETAIGDSIGEMDQTSVQITNVNNITEIKAADTHVCVSFNSTAYSTFNTRCWGNNDYGQLGLGRLTEKLTYFKEAHTPSTYDSTDAACNPSTLTGGNNCTTTLGKLPSNWSESYTNESAESLSSTGHDETDNHIMQKAGTTTSTVSNTYSVGTYSYDLNVNNNQFVQLYYPINSLSGGRTFNCGAVQTTFGTGPAVTVRCWGSNVWYNGSESDEANLRDWGLLNNHGYSVYYEPFADGNNGFMDGAVSGKTCYLGSNTYDGNTCEFMNHLVGIGDDGGLGILYHLFPFYYAHGNVYVTRWYLGQGRTSAYDIWLGWAKYFPGAYTVGTPDIPSSVGINHEMHANSHSKFSFPGATKIEIKSGSFETCALPKTGASGTNRSIKCWGANHYGQLGVDWTGHNSCEPKVIGDSWACGEASTGVSLSFNYSF